MSTIFSPATAGAARKARRKRRLTAQINTRKATHDGGKTNELRGVRFPRKKN